MREKIKKIKLIATDVDGVLTDGGMYYSSKGDVLKKFQAIDGMAVSIFIFVDHLFTIWFFSLVIITVGIIFLFNIDTAIPSIA